MIEIRNIGISAHIDAGKTTTTERILYFSGLKHKMGEVHEGNTTMDWMDLEQERGITINSASITVFWYFNKIKHQINIIDTPGHVDFTMEVERSMRVIDGACMIYCSVGGIQAQSETVWRQSIKYKVSKLIFINKMDRVGSNFYKIYEDLKKKLGANPLPICLPFFFEDKFLGIVDLINFKLIIWDDKNLGFSYNYIDIPKNYLKISFDWRNKIIEYITIEDDFILNKFLIENLFNDEIIKIIRLKTIKNEIQPMMCGSSFKNKGVQFLLNSIIQFLPSPSDGGSVKCFLKNGEEYYIEKNYKFFSALAFKSTSDSFLGNLIFFRIYSGKIKTGDVVLNSNNKTKEKISKILRIYANHKEDIDFALAGDIIAVSGLKNIKTGDTICDLNHFLILEKIDFPEPVISQRLILENKTDEDKILPILNKISVEDPSFKYFLEIENKSIIICGMGELHLEVIIEKVKRENKLNISVDKPKVSYKETVLNSILNIEGKYIRQSGGRGQYGHVVINIEPNKRGEGSLFLNKIKSGVIPKEYIACIEKSFEENLKHGPFYGYPVVDILVYLVDGSFHDVDSSENAFKMAYTIAFKEAMKKLKPVVLEPIMILNIEIPENDLGNVLGDINSKRGNLIEIQDNFNNYKLLKCSVPLSNLFNYSTDLRSITKGRGIYNMSFAFYSEVPENILKIIFN